LSVVSGFTRKKNVFLIFNRKLTKFQYNSDVTVRWRNCRPDIFANNNCFITFYRNFIVLVTLSSCQRVYTRRRTKQSRGPVN